MIRTGVNSVCAGRQPWDLLEKSEVPLQSKAEMLEGVDLIFQSLSFKMSPGGSALFFLPPPRSLAAPGVLDLAYPCSITHESRALLTPVSVTDTSLDCSTWFRAVSVNSALNCVNCYTYSPILVPSVCFRGCFCLMSICSDI